ncbi:MAG: SAM-dependent methyltransferase [Ginsengibacter sp.]
MELEEIIIQKIKNIGAISFHDFMEMALYYPGKGYYTSGKSRIGKSGDYYTSPALTSLFGQMIGSQVEEMFFMMGSEPISIVEYGAGSGALCLDILIYLQRNELLFQHLKYYIIEKNDLKHREEKNALYEKVEFIDNISEITGFTGCVLSNELVDNFPVNVVVMKDELMEVFVDYKDSFVEVLLPAKEELKDYLKWQNIELPNDYRTEINLESKEWIRQIALSLRKGFVITIDYGFPGEELYSSKRNTGSMVCYHNHTVTDMPYHNIGGQDITTHVNFSAINLWGKELGLDFTGFCNQNLFLRAMGLANHLRKIEHEMLAQNKEAVFLQVNKLLMEMSNQFKILIQHKGVKVNGLRGMQFSQSL